VQACGIGALSSVQLEDADMQRLVESEKLQVLHPEYGTRPRVYYKNLYHVTQCFIGGTVISQASGVKDCVSGATVAVSKAERRIADARTDSFGEFRIDRLDPQSGGYTVEIDAPGHQRAVRSVELAASVYLGTIELSPLAR
jgi:hypothetical protein